MKSLALYWRSIFAILVPIVLLPVFLLNNSTERKWLYVFSVMILFWMTEAIPHSVTSLIPIALFPLLGIKDTVDICKLYVHETIFTFLGSLIIAASVEACNLHKRIALKVLCHVKCFHRRLHFVMMVVTMFISMWMQNLTVVAMMSPICLSILEQLEVQGAATTFKSESLERADGMFRPTRIKICYLLGISYAATFGGCGSMLGTPTNLAFKGIFETYTYEMDDFQEIDFFKFFLYGAPIMLLNTHLTWLWLQFLFMGLLRPKSDDAVAVSVTDESAQAAKENIILNYKAMGKLTAAEIQVAILLVAFQLVLVFRSPYFMQHGWQIISESKVRDASPTILFVIILFVIPFKWICCGCCRNGLDENLQNDTQLTWTFVRRKVPWGLIFLLGAGVAISASGRDCKIFERNYFSGIPPLGISFIVCLVCQIFTEFLSNAAAANIILPLLAAFCHQFEIDSLDLMYPAALSISMAFHTPIGTSGNAYVAGLINISVKEMFYCGIGPSIITLLTYWSTFPTYGMYINKPLNNTTATY